jgi:hypothetical protein
MGESFNLRQVPEQMYSNLIILGGKKTEDRNDFTNDTLSALAIVVVYIHCSYTILYYFNRTKIIHNNNCGELIPLALSQEAGRLT